MEVSSLNFNININCSLEELSEVNIALTPLYNLEKDYPSLSPIVKTIERLLFAGDQIIMTRKEILLLNEDECLTCKHEMKYHVNNEGLCTKESCQCMKWSII